MCGREYTVDEIFEIIIKDKRFYDASGGGVTFSGGECMLQIDFLVEILKRCHENRIPTAVDTAGHVPYSYFERILPYTDLLLYDIKCFDSEKHVKYTGGDNGMILENLEKLLLTDTPIWVRIPIISGVNDSEDEMRRIKGFLESRKMPQKIELLPYHAMGEHKYSALSRELTKFSAPCEEQMRKFKDIFNISEV
jgi:pyruvate formate lyase activating enzyme